jgi:hypothetical protein
LKEYLAGVLTLLCAVTVGCGGRIGFDVLQANAPIQKLPADAKMIHFANNPGFRNPNIYLEFSTAEANFLEWARQQPNVKQVEKPEPFVIYRFSEYPGDVDRRGTIVVDRGYLFEWINPNDGDNGEHIAFDLTEGRVYCWSHDF